MGKQDRTHGKRSKKGARSYSIDSADIGLKQLEHELAAQGLYIKDIVGDGNCLFRSLSDQLGQDNTHEQIRHDVVTYLRDRSDEFSAFVEEDYEKYIDRMSDDGVYGDNLEIVAFSRVYQKPVKIYQPGLSYVVKPDDSTSAQNEEMMHIVYHSYEHYSSVRNKDGPHDGPPKVCPVKTTVAPLTERDPDAPASDLEKICLASVPEAGLEEVRQAMQSCNGNVNAALDLLLEQRCQADADSVTIGVLASKSDPSVQDDPEVLSAQHEVASAAKLDDAMLRTSDALPAAVETTVDEDKSSPRRRSARIKKEQAKRAQKEAARDRKKKAKTRPSKGDLGDDDALLCQVKTVNI